MGALNRSVVAPLSSAIITVMLAGLVVAGVDSLNQNKIQAGTARLEPNGIVEVSVAGGPFTRASHGRTLRANDAVRVIDGRAVLELPHASKVELRAGSALTVNGTASPSIALNEGDLLVESGPGDTVAIDGGTSLISVAGSAKLRRGISLAAGVYEGTTRLQRNEQGLTIPQYRQAAVVGTGILPQSAEPLGLAPTDEWDRRILGTVMALDEQLTLFARSFEAAAPPAPDAEFFKQVSPKVASLPITPELLGGRSAGENLVGLTLVSLSEGDFQSRVQGVFGFRTQGATWGLVAADRGINPNPVLGDLEAALGKLTGVEAPSEGALGAVGGDGRRPINFSGRLNPNLSGTGGGSSADSTGGAGTGGTGGSGGTGGTGGTGGSGGSGGGGGGGGGTPTPGRKLIDVPQTGTFLDPLLDPLVTPVEDLLSGLLGGLLGQGTPSTGDTGSTDSTAPLSPVTSPIGTATQPTSSPTSGTTGSGSTAASTGTGDTTATGSTSGSTSTPTTTPTTAPTTTTTTSPGLLGGLVGGLTNTVGSLL